MQKKGISLMSKKSLMSLDVSGVVWCNAASCSCTRAVLVGLLVVTVKSVTPCFTDMWNLVDRLIMIDSLYW